MVRISAPAIRAFASLVVVPTIVAGALTIPPPAGACTWSVPLPHLAEYADDIAVAFVGRQIDRTEDEQRAVLTFEVERVYKGEAGPLIQVIAPRYDAPCGTFHSEGTTAVVAELVEQDFRWVKPGELAVNSILEPSIVDLEEVFGASYPPDPTIQLPEPHISERSGYITTIRQLAYFGIGLVIIVAGLIAIRRRQREGQ